MRDCIIRTAAAVALYDTSTRCTYSSLEPLVPGAACLVTGTVHASTQQTTNQRYGGVSRASKLLVGGDYLAAHTCYKQSNAFLLRRRRRSAFSPWKVDPLRSTTLRGIRSARSGLGQRSGTSSALHRKSCHALVSVVLEKSGGRCRTDGPIRVPSCQTRHTIAAIKATWCRSLC